MRKDRKRENLVGLRFGNWKVIAFSPNRDKHGSLLWVCRCSCGKIKEVRGSILIRGHSKSCKKCKSTTHGMTYKREYRIWTGMKQRCNNSNVKAYSNYGGRGIAVCHRWMEFSNFIHDMGKCPSGYTIDRINNDGPYSPDNCRWASYKEQSMNTRANRNVTIGLETKCLAEWARHYNVKVQTVQSRLRRNKVSVLEALEGPPYRSKFKKNDEEDE